MCMSWTLLHPFSKAYLFGIHYCDQTSELVVVLSFCCTIIWEFSNRLLFDGLLKLSLLSNDLSFLSSKTVFFHDILGGLERDLWIHWLLVPSRRVNSKESLEFSRVLENPLLSIKNMLMAQPCTLWNIILDMANSARWPANRKFLWTEIIDHYLQIFRELKNRCIQHSWLGFLR